MLEVRGMHFEGCYTFCDFGEVFGTAELIVGGRGKFTTLIFVDILCHVCRHWHRGDLMSYKKHCKPS